MTLEHGDRVTVYDNHGHVEARGAIRGIHQIVGGAMIYDVQPDKEFSMASRLCGIPASRVRKAYGLPVLVGPKHIDDEL